MTCHLLFPAGRQAPFRLRLRLTTNHPMSSYGLGVLLSLDGVILSGELFRGFRDGIGCTLEAPDPAAACAAMGVPAGEPGVIGTAPRTPPTGGA